MSKLIEELWYGTLDPQKQFGRSNPEMRKLEAMMQYRLEKLRSCLSEEEREALERYTACMDEYLLASTEQAFSDGFGVGVRLTAEGFVGTDGLLEK